MISRSTSFRMTPWVPRFSVELGQDAPSDVQKLREDLATLRGKVDASPLKARADVLERLALCAAAIDGAASGSGLEDARECVATTDAWVSLGAPPEETEEETILGVPKTYVYIGGAALGGILLGALLARKRK